MNCLQEPRIWTDTLVQNKQWKKDMRFGTWNVRNIPLTAAGRELARCKLDLVVCRRLVGTKGTC